MTEKRRKFVWLELLVVAVAIGAGLWFVFGTSEPASLDSEAVAAPEPPDVDYLWDEVPDEIRESRLNSGESSNIRLIDYAGPESCKECHKRNYESWSQHSHRWMNAEVSEQTLKADFSGNAHIDYMGGHASFYTEDGEYRVRMERGDIRRTYRIVQTIGSRFFQSVVGRLLEGPEPPDDPIWSVDLHIPFTYWLDRKEWIPETHVGLALPEGARTDIFGTKGQIMQDANGCATCHTTPPMGDWLMSRNSIYRASHFTPRSFAFLTQAYLEETHPDLPESRLPGSQMSIEQFRMVSRRLEDLPAAEYAATLGISCEACHNGCREHVEDPSKMPHFFPASEYLFVEGKDPHEVWGRTADNINWICSRCHTGARPRLAGGMSSSNSNEWDDAMGGNCYQRVSGDDKRHQLSCVHCHDPHKAIGSKWSVSPAADDAKCIDCHPKYNSPETRLAHTHHPEGSSGARCMNCHMPRLTEGLQDVVRTHMIFSPTDRKMIEANQANACNLCHVEKPIDWTLTHLKKWYPDATPNYSEAQLAVNYPDRNGSAAVGWVKGKNEFMRMVGADALARAGAKWALPVIIDQLDDPYLVNRQFIQKSLDEMLGIDTRDFGYRFYMSSDERREPLKQLRTELLKKYSESENNADASKPGI